MDVLSMLVNQAKMHLVSLIYQIIQQIKKTDHFKLNGILIVLDSNIQLQQMQYFVIVVVILNNSARAARNQRDTFTTCGFNNWKHAIFAKKYETKFAKNRLEN